MWKGVLPIPLRINIPFSTDVLIKWWHEQIVCDYWCKKLHNLQLTTGGIRNHISRRQYQEKGTKPQKKVIGVEKGVKLLVSCSRTQHVSWIMSWFLLEMEMAACNFLGITAALSRLVWWTLCKVMRLNECTGFNVWLYEMHQSDDMISPLLVVARVTMSA